MAVESASEVALPPTEKLPASLAAFAGPLVLNAVESASLFALPKMAAEFAAAPALAGPPLKFRAVASADAFAFPRIARASEMLRALAAAYTQLGQKVSHYALIKTCSH